MKIHKIMEVRGTVSIDGIIDLPVDAPVGYAFAPYAGLDDPVIEIAITPNRADCLGVRGVARDLAAAGYGRLKQLDTAPHAVSYTHLTLPTKRIV